MYRKVISILFICLFLQSIGSAKTTTVEIQKGEKYEYVAGCWDGAWDTYKTCSVCLKIRDDICCGFYIYGTLRETIREEFYLDYVTGEFLKIPSFSKLL